jgi:hypothetical protein
LPTVINPLPKVYQVVGDRRTGQPVQILGEVKNPEQLFTLPPEDTVLWRYNDYNWARALITEGSLYFRRADKFKDRLEGRFTKANREGPSTMFAEAAAKLPTKAILPIQESHRSHVYVNCWHKNLEENPRMWREYTTGPESIAIKTDLLSLFRSTPEEINGSNVHYVQEDYPVPEFHSLAALVHKRRDPFEFEQEFRLIYQLRPHEIARPDDEADAGRKVPVDRHRLIHLIRFHPDASADFKETVRQDLAAAGLSVPTESAAFPRSPA